MAEPLLAPDRVTLLLALVPYLREHGPTPVAELAAAFDVPPALLRRLVRFLGTAGIPGETLSYQHEDLFDIDWDALEAHDIVSLTHTVAVDDTPRFAPAETAALIAGLQALTAVLPADDAELARSTARKLGAALGEAAGAPAVSVTAEARDPYLPQLITAVEGARSVAFAYRDAAGRESQRTVAPVSLTQESGAWYLRGVCRDRGAMRTFRVDQMRDVEVLAHDAAEGRSGGQSPAPESTADDGRCELIATLPERALSRIAGFGPEIIEQINPGRVRVRIVAWHPGSAVRLVQHAPGQVEIESPLDAVNAVAVWAERALSAYDA